MALSTTVFAPTVRAVQPAFIYSEGKVKIYFSFSSFNKIDDIKSLRYSLIDPNKKSTYGNNSLIIGTNKKIEILNFSQSKIILTQIHFSSNITTSLHGLTVLYHTIKLLCHQN